MNRENISQDTIDQYLQNELSQDDRIAFEKILKEDEGLQQDVKLTRHIINGFNKEGEKKAIEEMKTLSPDAFKAVLAEAEKKYHKEPESEVVVKTVIETPPRRLNKLFVTISSVAAVAIILLYVGLQPKYAPDGLFREYYTVPDYEDVPTRGGNSFTEEQTKSIDDAITFYYKGEYDDALAAFEKATTGLQEEDIPDDILFYISICRIEAGEVGDAIRGLRYLSVDDNIYNQDAQWYLALTYLKTGDREVAAILLSEINSNKEHLYNQSAKDLLAKLNEKNWF